MHVQPTVELKITGLTEAQAHHILEAVAEARGFTGRAPLAGDDLPGTPSVTSAPAGNGAAESDESGAPTATHDNRGVPYNATFHGPNFKADGSWKRRRNHDKVAGDAYEAQFLGKSAGASTATPGQVTAGAGVTSAPTASISEAAPTAAYAAPATDAPAATPTRYLPTVQEYSDKWSELCRNAKVTSEHQQHIEKTFGGHPCSPHVMNDDENRIRIWQLFGHWANGFKAF